jgi:predicted ATP-dependent serine protease
MSFNLVKCKNCSKWSGKETGYCQWCGHDLDEVKERSKQTTKIQEDAKKIEAENFKIIKSNAWYAKPINAVAYGIQMFFVGLMSVIMWLVSFASG